MPEEEARWLGHRAETEGGRQGQAVRGGRAHLSMGRQ